MSFFWLFQTIFLTYIFSYNIEVWHAYNLLFMIRNFIKYMVETLKEDIVIKNCKTNCEKSNDSGLSMIENLLLALIEVLVDVKVS